MKVDFNGGCLPLIVQDIHTLKVLKLIKIDQASFSKSIESHKVFYIEGETEKELESVTLVSFEVSNDAILFKGTSETPFTDFGEENTGKTAFLNYLAEIIQDRKENCEVDQESYTASLFRKGINKIAQKVGEEAVEIVIEAKDDNKALFMGEAGDLLFHFLVLLEAKDYQLDEVIDLLIERHSDLSIKK